MGITIPGYRIQRRLGKGGMSHVFLATQISFERQVAVKLLSPTLALEPRFAERFMHEARTVASLNHPHIVPVYDVGEQQGYYYLTMEYVTGGSLKQRIESGMDSRDAEVVLRQLASALHYAGEHGVIHRDVKPDNILFRADGSALLVDFGIAANTLRDSDSLDGPQGDRRAMLGTPKYMSPEQHRSETLSPQSDLYALGCVFYEMLTGTPPYQADSHPAMAEAHLHAPLPRLPAPLAQYQPLIQQLLAKDPGHRFDNGKALLAALDVLENVEAPASSPSGLPPRLRLKETKAGLSWRGNRYHYDIYLVADDLAQFQSHVPVLRSALLDWHRQRGSRCQSLSIKATLQPHISPQVKDFFRELHRHEGLEFVAQLPVQLNLVASDGEPIERLHWQPHQQEN